MSPHPLARLATHYYLPRTLLPQRAATEWQNPLANGRLLILSCFNESERRVTADLAALADEVWFAHITPGGQMERLARIVSV
jgi:hypothetical protein